MTDTVAKQCCDYSIEIKDHWLVEVHDHCTCGVGPGGYYGAHEAYCGVVELSDLATTAGWDELVKYVWDVSLAEFTTRMLARDRHNTVARFTNLVAQFQAERDQAVTTMEAMLDESARWAGTEMGRTLATRLRHVVEENAR